MPSQERFDTTPLYELMKTTEGLSVFYAVTSSFSSLNKDVEEFIKTKSIQSVKLKTSSTYLVTDLQNPIDLLGYFTLATKMLSVKKDSISRTHAKIIQQFGYYDEDSNSIKLPALLIAQFSRNFNSKSQSILGKDLMDIALKQVEYIMSLSSGKVVFLECEKIKKLTDFYESSGFRFLDNDVLSKNNQELTQMYKII